MILDYLKPQRPKAKNKKTCWGQKAKVFNSSGARITNDLKSTLAKLFKNDRFRPWDPFHEIGLVEILRMVVARAPELLPRVSFDHFGVGRSCKASAGQPRGQKL